MKTQIRYCAADWRCARGQPVGEKFGQVGLPRKHQRGCQRRGTPRHRERPQRLDRGTHRGPVSAHRVARFSLSRISEH